MKSSQEQLRNRGFATEADYQKLKYLSDEALREKMHSINPNERTAAITLLRELNETLTYELLDLLISEKALYTRLAICQRLEKGDIQTARIMVSYLGKVGNNQHQAIPTKVFKKKSYPLPRDLVARSLSKMTPSIMDTLWTAFDCLPVCQLSELIDAIGFLTFYHPELATAQNGQKIIQLVKASGNELISWKALICLSAFPCAASEEVLKAYSQRSDFLGKEAQCALSRMRRTK